MKELRHVSSRNIGGTTAPAISTTHRPAADWAKESASGAPSRVTDLNWIVERTFARLSKGIAG
jgi:hypothetical protein